MSSSPMNASVSEAEQAAHRRAKFVLRMAIVLAGLALITVLVMLRSGGGKIVRDEHNKLRILRSFSVPLREVSGLSKAGKHIFAVGDSTPLLGVLRLNGDELEMQQTVDFTAPLWHNYFLCPRQHNSICRSLAGIINKQWEGLYYDAASDTIQVLQESTGAIFVFNRTMDRILSRTMLDFFLDRDEKKSARTSNSLGEGFVPLADGRVLVAKEKFPAAIIEFGAQDGKARGYNPRQPPRPKAQAETVRTLYPRHYWHLPKSSDKHCDLSDVTHDDEGTLYAISQVCRRIYQLDTLDPRDEQLQIVQSWDISSSIKAPEALVVLNSQLFLVASDVKNLHNNLWLLSTADYQQHTSVAQDDEHSTASVR